MREVICVWLPQPSPSLVEQTGGFELEVSVNSLHAAILSSADGMLSFSVTPIRFSKNVRIYFE